MRICTLFHSSLDACKLQKEKDKYAFVNRMSFHILCTLTDCMKSHVLKYYNKCNFSEAHGLPIHPQLCFNYLNKLTEYLEKLRLLAEQLR